MVDFTDFKAKYPELVIQPGDTNQATIESCIALAEAIFGTPPCPKLSDNLLLAHAANCVAKSADNPNGAADGYGTATSKSVGSVSISYQVAESKGSLDDWYKGTPYGQEFLMLQKYCYGAGIMTAP